MFRVPSCGSCSHDPALQPWVLFTLSSGEQRRMAARTEPLIGGKHYPFTPCGAAKDKATEGWMRGFSLESRTGRNWYSHESLTARRAY